MWREAECRERGRGVQAPPRRPRARWTGDESAQIDLAQAAPTTGDRLARAHQLCAACMSDAIGRERRVLECQHRVALDQRAERLPPRRTSCTSWARHVRR